MRAVRFYRANRGILRKLESLRAAAVDRNAEIYKLNKECGILQREREAAISNGAFASDGIRKHLRAITKTSTCPCDPCKLIRKYPDYSYIQRVVKAVARGDAD